MRFILFLLFLMTVSSYASSTVSTYCPKPSDLTRTKSSSSWAKYTYTGQASINLPEVNNTLHLTADSNAETATYFYGATWTDRTFLCLYNYLDDAIVMYEGQLDPLVERCYFAMPGTSECLSSNPSDCALTCQVNNDN